MRKHPSSGELIFSPSDLVRYLESPFASWMARHHLEHPGELERAPQSEDMKLIAASVVASNGESGAGQSLGLISPGELREQSKDLSATPGNKVLDQAVENKRNKDLRLIEEDQGS